MTTRFDEHGNPIEETPNPETKPSWTSYLPSTKTVNESIRSVSVTVGMVAGATILTTVAIAAVKTLVGGSSPYQAPSPNQAPALSTPAPAPEPQMVEVS